MKRHLASSLKVTLLPRKALSYSMQTDKASGIFLFLPVS